MGLTSQTNNYFVNETLFARTDICERSITTVPSNDSLEWVRTYPQIIKVQKALSQSKMAILLFIVYFSQLPSTIGFSVATAKDNNESRSQSLIARSSVCPLTREPHGL